MLYPILLYFTLYTTMSSCAMAGPTELTQNFRRIVIRINNALKAVYICNQQNLGAYTNKPTKS